MHESAIAKQILNHVFVSCSFVDGVLAVLPLAVAAFTPVKELFQPLTPKHAEYSGPKVYACERKTFVPAINIRSARIEDHDDLVPIFNAQSEVLTSIYGEFFLAELIESQSASNHALVAELPAIPAAGPGQTGVAAKAVGLMAITDECDVRLLTECFDLAPYDRLKKQTLKEVEVVQTKTQEVVKETTADPKLIAEKLQRTFDVCKMKEDERADASDDDDVCAIPIRSDPPLTH